MRISHTSNAQQRLLASPRSETLPVAAMLPLVSCCCRAATADLARVIASSSCPAQLPELLCRACEQLRSAFEQALCCKLQGMRPGGEVFRLVRASVHACSNGRRMARKLPSVCKILGLRKQPQNQLALCLTARSVRGAAARAAASRHLSFRRRGLHPTTRRRAFGARAEIFARQEPIQLRGAVAR